MIQRKTDPEQGFEIRVKTLLEEEATLSNDMKRFRRSYPILLMRKMRLRQVKLARDHPAHIAGKKGS